MVFYPTHLGVLAVYLLITIGLAVIASRHVGSSEDMLVSGRRMGLFMVACAIAAEYMGGLGTIGCAERAFSEGMGVVWYHVAASCGLLVFGLFFAHYYRKHKIQTIPELLYYMYDIRTWKTNAIMNIIAYTFFVVIEVTALGSILSGITGLPLIWCALAGGLFITLYVCIAGMWSIAFASLLYMATIYISMPLAFWYTLTYEVPPLPGAEGIGGFAGMANVMISQGMDPSFWFSPFSLGSMTILGFFLGGILAVPAAQATVNYAFGARNWKIARFAPVLAAFLVVPLSIWTGSLGLFARISNLTTVAKLSLPATLVSINPWVGAIAAAGIFAAIVSTADSILFAAAGILAKDVLNRWLKPHATDKEVLRLLRISILVLGLACSLGAMTLPKLLNQAYFVYSLRSCTFVVVLFGIYWKRAHPDAAFWSLLLGTVAAILYQFDIPFAWSDYFFNLHVAVFTAAVAIPVFIVVSIARKWTPKTAAAIPPAYRR